MRRLPILLLLTAWWPLQAWAFDTTMPMETFAAGAPAAPATPPAPCHAVGDELASADACALCANCHLPAAPAPTGSAPRPAAAPGATPRTEPERRSVRQPVERLDRPPFIRPM